MITFLSLILYLNDHLLPKKPKKKSNTNKIFDLNFKSSITNFKKFSNTNLTNSNRMLIVVNLRKEFFKI